MEFLALVLALGAAGAAAGWWAPVALALGWGLLRPAARPALVAGAAAALAALARLAWTAAQSPRGAVARLSDRLGGLMPGGEPTALLLTLLLPALLAAAAASLGAALRARRLTSTMEDSHG